MDINQYLNTTLRFLSFRGRSEKEIRDYLQKKKALPEIIEKIIVYCKDHNFLNDERFAQDWIRSRSAYRLKSKRIIKIELLKKGIDPQIIERTLNQGHGQINDLEQAKKLVGKKIKRFKDLPKNVIYQKLGGFLSRRGFDWDTIEESIDDVLKSEYNK